MSKQKNANGQAGPPLDIPVEFGGVSIGDATARLGIRIDRSVLNIVAADEAFCGHRLTGRVVLGAGDDQSGQTTLVDDLYHKVEGVFDVKRIGVNAKNISTGLTFSLSDIDIEELAKFSKGSGRLIVEEVAELPDDTDDDSESESLPGTLRADGPWRDVPLDDLFEGNLLKCLNQGKLKTVGDLADYTAKPHQVITDIPGVGPSAAEKIDKIMLEFWRDNPQEEEALAASK